ncbi:MAG TPA: hypothetical protein EYO59_04020 [Chromatiaceae bacterium]|nr:hypothetical protein [Chromatiaceae bacterium]
MKYLITISSRIGTEVPKPNDPPKLFAAVQAWNQLGLDEGRFDCVYGFSAGRGGVSIVNADSHEDLMRILRSSPMYHFANYDIQSLCDINTFWDIHLEAIS